jgi:hypothetical protein
MSRGSTDARGQGLRGPGPPFHGTSEAPLGRALHDRRSASQQVVPHAPRLNATEVCCCRPSKREVGSTRQPANQSRGRRHFAEVENDARDVGAETVGKTDVDRLFELLEAAVWGTAPMGWNFAR